MRFLAIITLGLLACFLVACDPQTPDKNSPSSSALGQDDTYELRDILIKCNNKTFPEDASEDYCAPKRILALLQNNPLHDLLDFEYEAGYDQITFLAKDETIVQPGVNVLVDYVRHINNKLLSYDAQAPHIKVIYNPRVTEEHQAAAVFGTAVLFIGHGILAELLAATSLEEILTTHSILPHEEFHVDQEARLTYLHQVNPGHGRLICLEGDDEDHHAPAAVAALTLLGQPAKNPDSSVQTVLEHSALPYKVFSVEEGYGHLITLRNILGNYDYSMSEDYQKQNIRHMALAVLLYTRAVYRFNSYLYYFWINQRGLNGELSPQDRGGIFLHEGEILLQMTVSPDQAEPADYILAIPRQILGTNDPGDIYASQNLAKIISFLKEQNIYLRAMYDWAKKLAAAIFTNDAEGTLKEGWQDEARELIKQSFKLDPATFKGPNPLALPYEGQDDSFERINQETIPFNWERHFLTGLKKAKITAKENEAETETETETETASEL